MKSPIYKRLVVLLACAVVVLPTATTFAPGSSGTPARAISTAPTDIPRISYTNPSGHLYEKLYPVYDGGRGGYIDSAGAIVIPPCFRAVGEFSEGLAAVRFHGTYGYINTSTGFIIPPQYDYALPFRNGIAKVYIDGKPFFIDKKGKLLFRHNFKEIEEFGDNGDAIVTTHSGDRGIINRKGRLIADTVFGRIGQFRNGVAVVEGSYNSRDAERNVSRTGVIDLSGKWIVRYGAYSEINSFHHGYALATEGTGKLEEKRTVIINTKGKVCFKAMQQGNIRYEKVFSDSLAVVTIHSGDLMGTEQQRHNFFNGPKHCGLVNTSGRVVVSDPSWTAIVPFSTTSLFVQRGRSGWILIDGQGRQRTEQVFDDIGAENLGALPYHMALFPDGRAIVRIGKEYGIIDTTGRFAAGPRTFNFEVESAVRSGDILMLYNGIGGYEARAGFWNTRTNVVVEPVFSDIDIAGFGNDLIAVVNNKKPAYMNPLGTVLWSASPGAVRNVPADVDYMTRGYCRASSARKKELEGYGGWAGSENESQQLSPGVPVRGAKLQMVLDPQLQTGVAKVRTGITLYVANTAADTMYFEAQDSRLSIKMQALDKNGTWRDIEYLPNSWCGNSYHRLFLAPGEYWTFTVPEYTGELKTRLRAQLVYETEIDGHDKHTLYSNEIEGSVNPGQFWRKPEYQPAGIMDPYNE